MELDVIVFESGDRRFALELQFVQGVFTLGHVTPVPRAPLQIRGATNVRGKMVPVVSLESLFGLPLSTHVLLGSTAILVAVEETTAALPVRRVIDVKSLSRANFEQGGEGSGPLVPGSFRGVAGSIPLLDLEAALARVQSQSTQANRDFHTRAEAR